MSEPDPIVSDDPATSRFTLHLDGRLIAHADYSVDGEVLTVHHVETDPARRGNGYAAVLMNGIIESVRSRDQRVRPLCSYAAEYIRDDPATHELVA
ncbi:GNAT family N-acetyltransferase [Ilumatobacter sp.]|uniref:GNAT family N-acetyltransferase n=1 Tax=Ilumatobacter sp. TaxID=1967498 RepID=UPI003C56AFFE